MQLEWSFWLVAIVGVLITGISKSGFAGGVGAIAAPLLALQVGPLRAAAIMLPLLIVMDFFSVKAWWGKQSYALLKILMPTAVVGIICGYLLFEYLNDDILQVMLGILSISFAAWGLLKGGKLGLKIQRRINDQLFSRCILVMLAAVGLKLILGSL